MRGRRKRSTSLAPGALARFSEPFPPHGALAAEGAENLLGRPRLDPLVVLVREAVQNSWDARLDPEGAIEFGVHARQLDAGHRDRLRTQVFTEPPESVRLRDVLDRDELLLLSLRDGGTTGLGGPVRADRPPGRREPSNFVDLLFNIGQPSERAQRGGTYGFGRTISFVVSEARAVVVYSRTRVGRRFESRFIGAAFTDHFTERDRRYTGRHWWGRSVDGSIEPVVGEEADQLAASLGIEPFDPSESGTTISVVAPDLRGRSPRQASAFLAGALVWNFWPKMLDEGRGPKIRFGVSLDGENVEVPDPQRVPPLPAFVASLRALHATESAEPPDGVTVDDIVLPRTGERIGRLALARVPVSARPLRDEGADEAEERGTSASFEGAAHHVALLRQPELVVQYLATAELASVSSEYGGVFKPEVGLDRAFARAEPPTHDAWHPELVDETKLRRFVAVSLRSVRDIAARAANAGWGGGARSIAPVTRALGELFGPSVATSRPVSTAAPRIDIGEISQSRVDQRNVSDTHFEVTHADGTTGTVIDAVAQIATHDGWIAEPVPAPGSKGPSVTVVGFLASDGSEVRGTRLVLRATDPVAWCVRTRSSPRVAVRIDLTPRSMQTPSVEIEA